MFAALPRPAQAQDALAGPGVVVGTVLDHDMALPIRGAAVHLVDMAAEGQSLDPSLTNEEGRFAFPRVPPGSYILRAEMLGYRTRSDTLLIVGGTETRVTLELAASPVPLDPITVEVVTRSGNHLEGFRERRDRLHGILFDRQAIDERSALFISAMFMGLPGIEVVRGVATRTGAEAVWPRPTVAP